MKDMLYWFIKLIVDAKDALIHAFTMIFKGIFEQSPVGKILKAALKIICQIIKWFMNNIWKNFACPILQAVLPIVLELMINAWSVLANILDGIQSILCGFGACIPELGFVRSLVDGMRDMKTKIENGALQCDREYNFNCFEDDDGEMKNPALPVATRCWAGYQPEAGDSSALSCTHADTCFNPATTEQVVCDACPLSPGEDFMSFACSSLTKKCTCGVQRFERTRCTTHEQCYSGVQGASCMRVSSPFAVAYSTTPCKDCSTQPMCIVASAGQPGYCACPFQVSTFLPNCCCIELPLKSNEND